MPRVTKITITMMATTASQLSRSTIKGHRVNNGLLVSNSNLHLTTHSASHKYSTANPQHSLYGLCRQRS